MSDNPPCMMCNHSADSHPIVGPGGSQSPCTAWLPDSGERCSCPGYIAHRVEHYREIEPTAEESYPGRLSARGMHEIISQDHGARGIGTLFEQFDEHPFWGSRGEVMLRGIEPGEVPPSMRNMMRVTRSGNVAMRYGRR